MSLIDITDKIGYINKVAVDEMAISWKMKTCSSGARLGQLQTGRGVVETPAFMPVGTQATVKGMTPEELEEIGFQIILSNTYHLYLRPGKEVLNAAGGLHKFMHWNHPILTDSGGFQVFSLSPMNSVTEEGVTFRSHIDGSTHFFSPEKAIDVQNHLGADIIMPLDHVIGSNATLDESRAAMERSVRWAYRCQKYHQNISEQALFAIVQGGIYEELRQESSRELIDLDFPGYAVGGLSVGETKEEMYRILKITVPLLPEDKPRYLMGIGSPDALLEGVNRGIDLFDSVLPTRIARNGRVMVPEGYLSLRNAKFAMDNMPIDEKCSCYSCQHYSRAYIRHLLIANEILALRLTTYHNLFFLANFMRQIRQALEVGTFEHFYSEFWSRFKKAEINM